ncbi:MAG TPA: surface-adhesin E family protein [Noviherbaspirillum sp.]
MSRCRFLRAAGLALIAALPALSQAQDDFDFKRAQSAASDRARKEMEEIYSQGEQKLAPPWRGLRMQDDAAVFIRAETASAGKNQVSIWTERELAVPDYFEKEKPYSSVRERFVVDCGARRLGVAEWAYYSGRYASGAVVAHDRNAQPDMSEFLPDSLESQIHAVACPKPPPKPVRKPKKPVKPKTGEDKAATSKDAQKQVPKKEAAKPAPKEAKKVVRKESRYTPRRVQIQRKKPAPQSEDAGKATATAGRR